MKVVIPGGGGHLGTTLATAFTAAGHDVVVLSRSPKPAPWTVVPYNPTDSASYAPHLPGADVVIGLAGRTVNCRYNAANLKQVLESRVEPTRALGTALAAAPPRVWLQMSTATIYSHRFDAANDERSGVLGGSEPDAPAYWKFSTDVARAWEKAAAETCPADTRLTLLRTAVVMAPDPGGAFAILSKLTRRGFGGTLAGGRQFMSWIHDRDFTNAVSHLIHTPLVGPVNVASPGPLPQAEFQRVLRREWGVPIGLPATTAMIKLGAFVLGTDAELVLKSRRVVPTRLLESGFHFAFPDWPAAAADLVARHRAVL